VSIPREPRARNGRQISVFRRRAKQSPDRRLICIVGGLDVTLVPPLKEQAA
jgi:hypothetical protein